MKVNEKYKDCKNSKELKQKLCENIKLNELEDEHPIKKELEDEIDSFIKEIFG